jgi:hypothetical protein
MKTVLLMLLIGLIGQTDYIEVSGDRLSRDPAQYIGVPIKLKCRFLKEDSTWLNDADVPRPSSRYAGFFVEDENRIFAQLFYPLSQAEELKRFERGDRLIIYGKVFSTRFNFPWIDVDKISEGWVIGEEPEPVRKERVRVAREYEDFVSVRRRILEELELDDVRDIYIRQEVLIKLLIEKGVLTRDELDREFLLQKVRPTPVPYIDLILEPEKR